jgi:hypothetical protein
MLSSPLALLFPGEAEHVLDDEEYKMEYKSEIRDAVMRAKERPCLLFSGYTFCLTKYIQPSPGVLSPIIKSSGGKVTSDHPAMQNSCFFF